MKSFPQEETALHIRTHGERANPVLIYLPGIHGDWTLLTEFAELAREKFFLVQITFPRTLSWTLDQYAQAVSDNLANAGISSGWILAESFSSQVAWAWLELAKENRTGFQFTGLILAGGFVKYPAKWMVRLTDFFFDLAPWHLWRFLFRIYFLYSGFRHRNAPGTADAVHEFLARRNPLDIAAMSHRLRLIVASDPRSIAMNTLCPVYLLAGAIDPIVPAWPVIRWLRKRCATFRGHRLIWPADHNVLGTEPSKSLKQIEEWILPKT